MSVRIVTDSAADFTKREIAELDIRVVPLRTIFGDREYLDGVELSQDELFEKITETGEIPSTSQVTPGEFAAAFDEYDEGDQILCMTMSSKLSGTNQSATMAAQGRDNVTVYDTLNVTVGQRLQVELALKLAEEGKDVNEIVAALDEAREREHLVAVLDTLEYLKHGGRISGAAAGVGTLLSIKPTIVIADGEVELIGKARGSKNANNLLVKSVQEAGGIDFDMPFAIAKSGESRKLLERYLKDSVDLYRDHEEDLRVYGIGAVIGTHVGPGAVALAYFGNER